MQRGIDQTLVLCITGEQDRLLSVSLNRTWAHLQRNHTLSRRAVDQRPGSSEYPSETLGWRPRAQPVNSIFSLRALAARNFLQQRRSRHRGAAERPAIRLACSGNGRGNSQVAGLCRPLIFLTSLTQHPFAVVAHVLLRCSACHQSSHSRASI